MDTFAELKKELAKCVRCGKLCVVGGPPNPEARLIPYATAQEAKTQGLCADCAVAVFIKAQPALMFGIELNGTKMLLDSRVQQRFGEIMVIGKADAKLEEVNWQRVVDNWELPIPKPGKRKKTR